MNQVKSLNKQCMSPDLYPRPPEQGRSLGWGASGATAPGRRVEGAENWAAGWLFLNEEIDFQLFKNSKLLSRI